MRDLCSKSMIVACLFVVAGFALTAAGQISQSVLPPLAANAPAPPVHLGTSKTSPSQSTIAPFWAKLNNAPPVSLGAMLVLTDGRVLAHEEPNCNTGPNCTGFDMTAGYVLTPDINGSYVNGTWSQVASMPPDYAPLYFSISARRYCLTAK